MKRTPLLNRHISCLIAGLGHRDEIVLADAGLPGPDGVPVIDLAVVQGVPGFFEVLAAIRTELAIEEAVYAEECNAELQSKLTTNLESWAEEQKLPITINTISHEAFKDRNRQAKAIIRTGETTPYANLILVSGVVF